MEKNQGWLRELAALAGAVQFFTRLPVPPFLTPAPADLTAAIRYFPLVGLLIGGVAALLLQSACLFWPAWVAILLSMLSTIILTGALHEDGLADMVDGLAGGWTRERILAIMKDPGIGACGAIALWGALTLKFALLATLETSLLPWAMVAGHVVSRTCAASLMGVLDYARDAGSSKVQALTGRLSVTTRMVLGLTVILVLWGVALPWPGTALGLGLALLATGWVIRQCRRWLGGYTGDCLGATQQLSELAFYLGLAAHWSGM